MSVSATPTWSRGIDPARKAELIRLAEAHGEFIKPEPELELEPQPSAVMKPARKPLKPRPKGSRRGVAIMRSDGKPYESCIDAALEMNCVQSKISQAAQNQGYSQGYRWRRKGEPWREHSKKLVRIRNQDTGETFKSAACAALSVCPDVKGKELNRLAMQLLRAARAADKWLGQTWAVVLK